MKEYSISRNRNHWGFLTMLFAICNGEATGADLLQTGQEISRRSGYVTLSIATRFDKPRELHTTPTGAVAFGTLPVREVNSLKIKWERGNGINGTIVLEALPEKGVNIKPPVLPIAIRPDSSLQKPGVGGDWGLSDFTSDFSAAAAKPRVHGYLTSSDGKCVAQIQNLLIPPDGKYIDAIICATTSANSGFESGSYEFLYETYRAVATQRSREKYGICFRLSDLRVQLPDSAIQSRKIASRWGADAIEPIETAIMSGNTALVARILASGNPSLEKPDKNGMTALHIASREGKSEIVKLLLDKGARVDAEYNKEGATALSLARLNEHPDVIKLLLERGAKDRTSNQ